MSHVRLSHFAAGHPATQRLRKRRDRQLRRAVRPSKRTEMWYRAELVRQVQRLRAAGAKVVEGLRPRWQFADVRRRVGDEPPPDLDFWLALAAEGFGDIARAAQRIASDVAKKNLVAVDDRIATTIFQSVGVDLRRALTPAGAISSALRKATVENVALITSIPEQYFARLREEITKSFETGLRWESLAEKVQYVGNVTESRARLIARDQTSKITGSFNQIRQMDLGIQRYTWSSVRDNRVRPDHRRLDGTIQRWDRPPVVDGEAIHPQQAINCRCAALPIIDLDEILGGQIAEAA